MNKIVKIQWKIVNIRCTNYQEFKKNLNMLEKLKIQFFLLNSTENCAHYMYIFSGF